MALLSKTGLLMRAPVGAIGEGPGTVVDGLPHPGQRGRRDDRSRSRSGTRQTRDVSGSWSGSTPGSVVLAAYAPGAHRSTRGSFRSAQRRPRFVRVHPSTPAREDIDTMRTAP